MTDPNERYLQPGELDDITESPFKAAFATKDWSQEDTDFVTQFMGE